MPDIHRYMMLKLIARILIPILIIGGLTASAGAASPKTSPKKKIRITAADLEWFGQTIFQKECAGEISRLCTWNKGEEFPSFGIGHFIWYPKGFDGPFEESFPQYIAFVKKRGVSVPGWIAKMAESGCPWKSRQEFYEAEYSPEMKSMRSFLIRTMSWQSLFIVNRFKHALPKMLHAASPEKKQHVRRQFYRVADSSRKLYALIDYVNFKGEGVRPTERYNNQGWGLLQVLEEMEGAARGQAALEEFSRAAEAVLVRRVNNAPSGRNEHRWLNGWKNRVSFYRSLATYL